MGNSQQQSLTKHTKSIIDKWSLNNVNLSLIGKHFGKIHAMDCVLLNNDPNNILIASIAQDTKLLMWNVKINRNKKGKIKNTVIKKATAINTRHAWCLDCAFSFDATFCAFGGLNNKITIYKKINDFRYNLCITIDSPRVGSTCYISCIKFIYHENKHYVIYSSGDGNIYCININQDRNKNSVNTTTKTWTPISIAQTHQATESIGLDVCKI